MLSTKGLWRAIVSYFYLKFLFVTCPTQTVVFSPTVIKTTPVFSCLELGRPLMYNAFHFKILVRHLSYQDSLTIQFNTHNDHARPLISWSWAAFDVQCLYIKILVRHLSYPNSLIQSDINNSSQDCFIPRTGFHWLIFITFSIHSFLVTAEKPLWSFL